MKSASPLSFSFFFKVYDAMKKEYMYMIFWVVTFYFLLMICVGKPNNENNDIVIKYNFLSSDDFNELVDSLRSFVPVKDLRTSERLSVNIDCPKINDIIFKYFFKSKHTPSFPIEYRCYFEGSKGMGWHSDTKLFDHDNYYEAVLTIDNESDSLFEYGDISMWVPPNTLVLVRPEGIAHRVTELTKGYRTILKFIVCDSCEGLENDNFYEEIKTE
jgi:hypothetical protein